MTFLHGKDSRLTVSDERLSFAVSQDVMVIFPETQNVVLRQVGSYKYGNDLKPTYILPEGNFSFSISPVSDGFSVLVDISCVNFGMFPSLLSNKV